MTVLQKTNWSYRANDRQMKKKKTTTTATTVSTKIYQIRITATQLQRYCNKRNVGQTVTSTKHSFAFSISSAGSRTARARTLTQQRIICKCMKMFHNCFTFFNCFLKMFAISEISFPLCMSRRACVGVHTPPHQFLRAARFLV